MEEGSTRLLKIDRELQRNLAEIIRRKGMAAFDGALLTVSEVRVSPDLSFAKVFVSIFPSAKQSKVMEMLKDQTRAIRGELGREMGHQLRIIPEILFCLDTTLDYVAHLDELLKK